MSTPLTHTHVLMMAGGFGQRMLASGISTPKPLVPILGVPLLERNLMQLARMGATTISIAVPASIPDLEHYMVQRGYPLLESLGIAVKIIVESTPLGTIGAAQLIDVPTLIVVNADNLSDIDLNAIIEAHHQSNAAMTNAVHQEPFTIPFAQVISHEDWIVEYKEKPSFPIDVASAIYVLDRQAIHHISPKERIGAPTLVKRLLKGQKPVRAWRHSANWIDVNHAQAVQKATSMIFQNQHAFEHWGPPEVEVVGALFWKDQNLLLERRPSHAKCYPDCWDSPGGKIEAGETPMMALKRELKEELGIDIKTALPLCVFDDVDIHSKRIFRHHVFMIRGSHHPIPQEGQTLNWFSPRDLPSKLALPAARSLAYHQHWSIAHA